MYICICQAVTESQIHQASQNGARTLKDLRRDLGVSSECGRCAGCARECLRQAQCMTEQILHAPRSSLMASANASRL